MAYTVVLFSSLVSSFPSGPWQPTTLRYWTSVVNWSLCQPWHPTHPQISSESFSAVFRFLNYRSWTIRSSSWIGSGNSSLPNRPKMSSGALWVPRNEGSFVWRSIRLSHCERMMIQLLQQSSGKNSNALKRQCSVFLVRPRQSHMYGACPNRRQKNPNPVSFLKLEKYWYLLDTDGAD